MLHNKLRHHTNIFFKNLAIVCCFSWWVNVKLQSFFIKNPRSMYIVFPKLGLPESSDWSIFNELEHDCKTSNFCVTEMFQLTFVILWKNHTKETTFTYNLSQYLLPLPVTFCDLLAHPGIIDYSKTVIIQECQCAINSFFYPSHLWST